MMKKLIAFILILACGFSLYAYTYDELNSMMLRGNLEILSAKEDMQSSLLDYKDAKGGYTPTVDLTVTGSYLLNPIDPIVLQRDDVLSFLGLGDVPASSGTEEYMTLYDGQENTMYQFQLQITQPLFTWGKIPKAVELYKTIYSARTLQVAQLGEQKSTEIKIRMAALVYMKQIRALLVDEIGLASQLVSLSQQAQINGILLETDVKDALVQSRQLDVSLAKLDYQIDAQLRALSTLCALDSLSLDEIDFAPEKNKYLAILNTDISRLESNALSESKTTFQLLGKLEEVASIANEIAGASVNWKPDVALVATLGYSGSRFPLIETDWYRKDSSDSTLTIAIKANVWDGGNAVRNVARTESQKSSAYIDTSQGKQEVRNTLRENYSNIQLASSMISYYDSKVESDQQKVDRQNELLSAGAASEADLIKAQMQVKADEIERLQELITLASAYYTVSYLGS